MRRMTVVANVQSCREQIPLYPEPFPYVLNKLWVTNSIQECSAFIKVTYTNPIIGQNRYWSYNTNFVYLTCRQPIYTRVTKR